MMNTEEVVGGVGIGRFVEDDAYERFNDLCSDLNLDSLTKDNTWRTFATVRQKYTLEVSPNSSVHSLINCLINCLILIN
jgi:hypothetical protein